MDNREIEIIINDYIISTNAENTIIFNNTSLFHFLANAIIEIFPKFDDETILDVNYSAITKMDVLKCADIVKNFFEIHNIDFDMDKHINDGTIGFECYDYFNHNEDTKRVKMSHLKKGANFYRNNRKLTESCNNGLITDSFVLIHEISHLRNQFGSSRNQVNRLLTEALAMTEELIFMDYLTSLGYGEDVNLNKFYFIASARNLADISRISFKFFDLFKEMGNISEESYVFYTKETSGYKNELNKFIYLVKNNRYNIYEQAWYIFGYLLSIHMYYEYKKDHNFFENIQGLHYKLHDSDILECLKIMNLIDLDQNDITKLMDSLMRFKDEFFELNNGKKMTYKHTL